MQQQPMAASVSTEDMVSKLDDVVEGGEKMSAYDCAVTVAEFTLSLGLCAVLNLAFL